MEAIFFLPELQAVSEVHGITAQMSSLITTNHVKTAAVRDSRKILE
jgi:hypothetical protein